MAESPDSNVVEVPKPKHYRLTREGIEAPPAESGNDELVRILEEVWDIVADSAIRGSKVPILLSRALTLARQGAEDTRRLDHVAAQFGSVSGHFSFKPGHSRYYHSTQGKIIGDGLDLRAAIDAAMKEAEGKNAG